MPVTVEHSELALYPESGRTVIRPFTPGYAEGFGADGPSRPQQIADRLMKLDEEMVGFALARIEEALSKQHRHFADMLLHRFDEVNGSVIRCEPDLSREVKMLVGSFFSAEYSFEAAALFNPSIVLHPDQSRMTGEDFRFVLALRGIGEGHLSSVTFRTGEWRGATDVVVDVPSPYSVPPRMIENETERDDSPVTLKCDSQDLSETVLFPILPSQSGGIEDLRLVYFTDDDGHASYIGTYTAFSGQGIRSEMLRTTDFSSFEMIPLTGSASKSKGMALFPRRVDGEYLMLGRQDNESIWLHRSRDLFDWNDGAKLISPRYLWDCAQMGNCGSPIEIDEGWLVVTHGIGPLRSYCIGAALLDKDDPAKVLGRTAHPVLHPEPGERDGYVPNVLYSCGALVRGRRLMLPYAVADNYTRFASIALDDLLGELE